jgi:hypothetical protein
MIPLPFVSFHISRLTTQLAIPAHFDTSEIAHSRLLKTARSPRISNHFHTQATSNPERQPIAAPCLVNLLTILRVKLHGYGNWKNDRFSGVENRGCPEEWFLRLSATE